MSRTQWQKCFDDAAVEGNLKCPGVAGLFVLCESNGMNSIALADIEIFFEKQEMPTDSDLGCSDLFALLEHLGWQSDHEEDDDADRKKTTDEQNSMCADPILEAIAQQIENKDRFDVKPEQVEDEEKKNEAMMICACFDVLQTESVMIQSKQDAMFAAYMASTPCDPDVSHPVRRARFARDSYYFNMRQVLEEQALTSRVLPRAMILGKFVPFVSVSKCLSMSKEDAQTLVDTVESSDLSEFERLFFERWDLIAQYAKYSGEKLESVFSTFVAKEYYPILNEVVERRPKAFTPKYDIGVGNASPEVKRFRGQLVTAMTLEKSKVLQRLVSENWEAQKRELSSCIREHITEEMIEAFEQTIYYSCMQTVLNTDVDAFTFIPAVKPSTVAETKLVRCVTKETYDRFQLALLQKWSEVKAKVPAFISDTLPELPPHSALQEYYYEVLQLVCAPKKPIFIFTPDVEPRTEHERTLVIQVNDGIAQELKLVLKAAWDKQREAVPLFMRSSLPEAPPANFLDEFYYDLLQPLVAREEMTGVDKSDDQRLKAMTTGLDKKIALISDGNRDEDMMSQFEYPTQATTADGDDESTSEAKYVSAMQVLTEDFPSDVNIKFEGLVLNPNAQTRSFGGGAADRDKSTSSSSKRGRDVQRVNKAIDLSAIDRTGAVTITLWGSDAEVAELLLEEWSRVHGGKTDKKPMIAVNNLRQQALSANKYNGTVLTRMNVLSNSRTPGTGATPCIVCIDKATSPYMISEPFVMPPAAAFFVRFNALDNVTAPFRVSLRGVVADVGGLEATFNGNQKKAFKLVDKEGSWVQCYVIGAQALKPGLNENADVILFFATGRGRSSSQEGSIFVFDAACIWNVGKATQKPRMTRQVHVQ